MQDIAVLYIDMSDIVSPYSKYAVIKSEMSEICRRNESVTYINYKEELLVINSYKSIAGIDVTSSLDNYVFELIENSREIVIAGCDKENICAIINIARKIRECNKIVTLIHSIFDGVFYDILKGIDVCIRDCVESSSQMPDMPCSVMESAGNKGNIAILSSGSSDSLGLYHYLNKKYGSERVCIIRDWAIDESILPLYKEISLKSKIVVTDNIYTYFFLCSLKINNNIYFFTPEGGFIPSPEISEKKSNIEARNEEISPIHECTPIASIRLKFYRTKGLTSFIDIILRNLHYVMSTKVSCPYKKENVNKALRANSVALNAAQYTLRYILSIVRKNSSYGNIYYSFIEYTLSGDGTVFNDSGVAYPAYAPRPREPGLYILCEIIYDIPPLGAAIKTCALFGREQEAGMLCGHTALHRYEEEEYAADKMLSIPGEQVSDPGVMTLVAEIFRRKIRDTKMVFPEEIRPYIKEVLEKIAFTA